MEFIKTALKGLVVGMEWLVCVLLSVFGFFVIFSFGKKH